VPVRPQVFEPGVKLTLELAEQGPLRREKELRAERCGIRPAGQGIVTAHFCSTVRSALWCVAREDEVS
jgi:hypothetical protein